MRTMQRSIKFLGITLIRKREHEVITCKKILFSLGPWHSCRLVLLNDGRVGLLPGGRSDNIFKCNIDNLDMTDIVNGLVKLGVLPKSKADAYHKQRQEQKERQRRRAARQEVTTLAKRAGIRFTRKQRTALEKIF